MSKSATIFACAAVAAASLVASSGCRTTESYKYQSTTHLPQTITLVDTSNGEQVWTVDIPVGQEVVFKFPNRPELAEKLGYDDMVWALVPIGDTPKGVQNRMRVPPPSSRRIDGTFRSAPELREGAAVPKRPLPPTPAGVTLPDPKQPAPDPK